MLLEVELPTTEKITPEVSIKLYMNYVYIYIAFLRVQVHKY